MAYYDVVAAGIAYSAYEVYSAYEAEGVEGALKQLGIEIVTDVVGAAALRAGSKVVYKLGTAVYPTMEAAVGAVLEKTPGLKIALGSLADKLVKAGDAVAHSALGKTLSKADDGLRKAEAKVGEKLGIKTSAQETAEKIAKSEAEAACAKGSA